MKNITLKSGTTTQINSSLRTIAGSGGGTLSVSGPSTITSTIQIGSNTEVVGDGTAVWKLKNSANWATMIPIVGQLTYKVDNIKIHGMDIDANFGGNTNRKLGDGFYNCIFLKHGTDLEVYDNYLHNGHGDGFRTEYSQNVKYHENKVNLIGHDGLYAIECKNVEAYNNKITCRTNSGIRIRDTDKAAVHHNDITGTRSSGPGIQIDFAGKATHVEVHDNVIDSSYGPGMWIVSTKAGYKKDLASCDVHNNIFKNCGTNKNIAWVAGIITSAFHNVTVENNTFYNCYGAGVAAQQAVGLPVGTSKDGFQITAKNNIIYGTHPRTTSGTGTGIGLWNQLTASHKITSSGNCIFACKGGAYKNVVGSGDILKDPMFADTTSFKLKDTSPCLNAGRWGELLKSNENLDVMGLSVHMTSDLPSGDLS